MMLVATPGGDSYTFSELAAMLEGFSSHETGFFRNKAAAIQGLAQRLCAEFGGELPGTLEQLVQLPGIGRKTANVILGNAFGVPGIPVDTHVGRLSLRMHLTEHVDPVKVEHDLMALIPKTEWTMFGHRMIFHGRQVCFARKPNCDGCTLNKFCPRIGVTESHAKPQKRKEKSTG